MQPTPAPSRRPPRPAPFHDRRSAGVALSERLAAHAHRGDVEVLALPRGGVPIGYEVATRLGLPLDVLVVRKLGVPSYPEVAMGAVASGDVVLLDDELIAQLGVSPAQVQAVLAAEREELKRREQAFRGTRPPHRVAGRTVVLVDDGLATGWTMRAAVEVLHKSHPSRLVVAVPVAAPSTCWELREAPDVDEVICLVTPDPFRAVGLWYRDFAETSDDEVHDLLARAAVEHERAVAERQVSHAR